MRVFQYQAEHGNCAIKIQQALNSAGNKKSAPVFSALQCTWQLYKHQILNNTARIIRLSAFTRSGRQLGSSTLLA